MVRTFSESGEYFFSDNLLSNETAYQKPAEALLRWSSKGGAYIGVGPEQNFTFIALTRPELAFIVDLRRDNLLLQLLYKALFELASTRTEFLCLLLGREFRASSDPGPSASLSRVLEAVRSTKRSRKAFEDASGRIALVLGPLSLDSSERDGKRIRSLRDTFFREQLDLRFELHEATSHRYPTLAELLAETDAHGIQRGFLATEEHFRFVQRLQREHRVVPIVGDFAGRHALSQVALELGRRKLTVSTFYVSNVEQYLFEGDRWAQWVKNLRALPTDERSLIVRVYLDQGRAHPRALAGHRSTVVLQRFEQFFDRQAREPFANHWQLVTEELFTPPP